MREFFNITCACVCVFNVLESHGYNLVYYYTFGVCNVLYTLRPKHTQYWCAFRVLWFFHFFFFSKKTIIQEA